MAVVPRRNIGVRSERVTALLMKLCSADSASYRERPIFAIAQESLLALGFEVYEDQTGAQVGGDVGNLIARMPGRGRGAAMRPLLFSAHMDRVAGGMGVKPVLDGGVVRSQGDTILGADDAAGIAALLEAYTVVSERGTDHPPLEIVLTIGEEVGLVGAKHLDYRLIQSKTGFVLDSNGPVGSLVVQAPTQYALRAQIFGRSAHAGIAPEAGISAIRIVAAAINRMTLGRIDAETTANVGYIAGGGPTNVVPERAEIRAEARSLDAKKVEHQVEHMKQALQSAADEHGGTLELEITRSYHGFRLERESEPVSLAEQAMHRLGIVPTRTATGGGSDANVFNANGIPSVVLGVGFQRIHTYREYMPVDQLVALSEVVAEIMSLGGTWSL